MTPFEPPAQLPPGVGIEGFHCGDPVVDAWVERHSAAARERGTAVIYAVKCGEDVAGFYTLSTHSVSRADSRGWISRSAPDQVPAILLGMMGVNAAKVARIAGARALVVDPSSEAATGFYGHFGFARLSGTSRMALKLI